MAPLDAHTDDPISVAAQRIADLNKNISNLSNITKVQSLIDVAQDKYSVAIMARDSKISAEEVYIQAVQDEATALSNLNTAQDALDLAQSDLNAHQMVVDYALQDKNDAKDALDIANINLQTSQSNMQSAGGQGLQYTVYSLIRTQSGATPDQVLCNGTWNSNSMQLPVCGNRYSNFIVKFTGQITVPSHWTSTYFAGYTDDGFRMFVNGNLAVNNWREQGATWSAYSPVYDVSQDKTLDVEIWWYNGGGPGSYHLGWAIPGGWTGAGCDYTGGWGVDFSCNLNTFSSGSQPTQEQVDAYNNATLTQTIAQSNYNNKLYLYDQSVVTLNNLQDDLQQAQQNKNNAEITYQATQTNTQDAQNALDVATVNYNQAIINMNDAITAAEEEYIYQWDFEEKQRVSAAIATALANQPQPTPEASVAPTPEPSPEPTKETPPTPEPSPEPTPEAPPTPEPSPEPTPEAPPTTEPTPEATVDPTPTPEPSPGPEATVDPEPTPEEKPGIQDEELAALVPENGTGTSEDLSGVIANLTSKDNKLVKLSPEQVAAVSQTLKALTQEAKAEIAGSLGISANEVAKIADQMKSNPELAEAFVEFENRSGDAGDTPMPFTLADAVTEVQTEAFLSDPLGAIFSVDPLELLSNFSELGMDMTDDQREKAQEVIIPVVIVSQIVSTTLGLRR